MTNCNIIIPTYNRPTYLRRILDYYSDYGKDFNIIVVDSSSDENKELNKNMISSVSNLDIKYLGDYPTEINPHHKMADMVNYAKEKYCVFCADDDFVTPDGINQSVDFLEKNPDFAVAHGYYILFRLEESGSKEGQFRWGTPGYSHKSIAFPDPKTRLTCHLSNYSLPTLYGVHRTELLKMVYKEALMAGVEPLLFGELLPSMLTLIYGKMKCLDVLYGVRDKDSGTLGYWPPVRDFIKAGIYNKEYAKFRDCLSIHLSKMSQLDIEESKKLVDDAMSIRMARSIKKHSSKGGKHILVNKISAILGLLNLPDGVDKGVRRLLTRLYGKLFLPRYIRDFPISMEISPSSKYYDDLNKIRLHVLAHSGKSDTVCCDEGS